MKFALAAVAAKVPPLKFRYWFPAVPEERNQAVWSSPPLRFREALLLPEPLLLKFNPRWAMFDVKMFLYLVGAVMLSLIVLSAAALQAEQDGALYFASEAKALFAMGVEAAWSHESLFAGAFLIPAERTLFRGVYNVPPGHFMRATPEGFRLQQYWDVNYPRDDAAPAPTSGGAPGVR